MKKNEKKTIGLTLFTRTDIKSRDIGNNLLSSIFQMGRDFSPTKLDYGKNWRHIQENNIMPILDLWVKSDNMLFRREDKYESELAILIGKTSNGYSILSYWIDEVYFELELHIQNFISLILNIYNTIHPDYGSVHQTQDEIEMATIRDPIYGPTTYPVNLDKGFPGVYWGNIFGPKNVDVIGKNKLLSAQCYETIELSDGGIFVRTTTSPLHANRERKQYIELRNYLGEFLFYPRMNNSL